MVRTRTRTPRRRTTRQATPMKIFSRTAVSSSRLVVSCTVGDSGLQRIHDMSKKIEDPSHIVYAKGRVRNKILNIYQHPPLVKRLA